MRILQLMDDQIRVSRCGWNAAEAEVAERMADVHRHVALQVHSTGTHQCETRFRQRLPELCQRHVVWLGDHRPGIALVDGPPKSGPQLLAGLARILLAVSGCHRGSSLPICGSSRNASESKAAQAWI